MDSLEPTFNFVKQHLDPAMCSGSYSLGFLIDLSMESFRNQLNVFRIIEEIAALEGRPGRGSSTKPPAMFKGKHLYGYWHKHHSQALYMLENLRLELARDETVERVWGKYIGQTTTPEMISELVHAVVHENYLNRAGQARLTGEWIVYSKIGGKNNYLTLARHDEGDEVIAQRIHHYEDIDIKTGWLCDKNTKITVTATLLPDGNVNLKL